MSVTRLTLLAPARDLSVGKSAVDAGADAVYIGGPSFGARQAAGNSVADIAALVLYAHTFGAEVLVTLNTLLHENEYAQAVSIARELYEVGVDALIIQDLRLLDYDLPPIRLHASTQCDNRTVEQVLRLQSSGFRRVVLARELGIESIRAISDAVKSSPVRYDCAGNVLPNIELEAFVHGALCVSYSGRCYMSEVLMDRSANRGCCAQMCRMRYDLLDQDGQEIRDDAGKLIHQRYLLSLQDMDRSHSLGDLADAGVTTFKIEGRLKDRDYVTNVVAYYSGLLDTLCADKGYERASIASVYHLGFVPNPEKTFHRGQTDYFLYGRRRPLSNWLTPKSTGEYIGEVVHVRRGAIGISMREGVMLHNGDGLCFGDQGFAVNTVSMSSEKDHRGHTVAVVTPNHLPRLEAGERLYRNQDIAFLHSLQSERRIAADIVFSVVDGGYRLQIGSHSDVFASEHQPAENRVRALHSIREQLSKLGGTVYIARTVHVQYHGEDCTEEFPFFVPIKQLNAWRRTVIAH